MPDDPADLVLKHALHNAASFGGKASSGAVMGKVLAERPDLKGDMRSVGGLVAQALARVNAMAPEEQKRLLTEKFSGFSEEREQAMEDRRKKDASGERELPALPGNTSEVRMRMAPYPSGPLHIGNARMAILNDEYVKRYGGRLTLFFDDTAGTEQTSVKTVTGTKDVAHKSILPEAYKLIPESLRWLGVAWHEEKYKSDRLELFYEHARRLIEAGNAYVCTCDGTEFRTKYKAPGIECPCRNVPVTEHLSRWQKMLDGTFRTGGAVVRLKSGMANKNPALRDHVIMRITEKEHPRVGKRYRVWPLLEFSWGIDDHLISSTHILRGADLVKEDWIEEIVWDFFGWQHAHFLHYGKFRLEEGQGMISKSKSKEMIEKGSFIGWDDPRTWSLQSLARRGIRPEAVRRFLLSFGMSIVDISVPPEVLYGMNREIIDPLASRYFFVAEPVELELSERVVGEAPLHPDFPERGKRSYDLPAGSKVMVEKEDITLFGEGPVRLKGMGAFALDGRRLSLSKEDSQKTIHFVPEGGSLRARVLMPDGVWAEGFAEAAARDVAARAESVGKDSAAKSGEEIVQFERFGFCRFDRRDQAEGFLEFWFAHK